MAHRVLAYIRQSRDAEQQANSEQVQFDHLMRFHEGSKLQSNSWPRDIHFERDIEVSGLEVPFFERRGGAAIKRIAQRGDKLICSKADRLSRSLRDIQNVADWCYKNGISLYLLDLPGVVVDSTSAVGVLSLQLLAMVAEFEARRGRERTKQALDYRKRTGRRYSRGPGHGKKFVPVLVDGKPVINHRGNPEMRVETDDNLCAAINQIMTMREKGYDVRSVVAYLNLHHPCPPHLNGGRGVWSYETVQYLKWQEDRYRRGIEHSHKEE